MRLPLARFAGKNPLLLFFALAYAIAWLVIVATGPLPRPDGVGKFGDVRPIRCSVAAILTRP